MARSRLPSSKSRSNLRSVLGAHGFTLLGAGLFAFVAAACGSNGDGGKKDTGDASTGGAGGEKGDGGPTNHGGSAGTGGKTGNAGNAGNAGGKGKTPDGGTPDTDGGVSEGGTLPDGSTPSTLPDSGPQKGDQKTLTMTGGTLNVTSTGGTVTADITVPSGAVTSDTPVTISAANLPSSAPSTVEQVATGFQIDLNGVTLKVAAAARIRVPVDATAGDLVIVSYSASGTSFIKYMIEMDGSNAYATFDVTQGGQYLAVRLVEQKGCDQTLAMAPTIAKQADVDALAKVRRIVGNVTISGTTITSLANLKCLQQVDGFLSITNTNVTSTDGLGQLTFVGTDYYYYNQGITLSVNALLDNVKLPSLLAVGNQSNYTNEGLSLSSNPVLTSVAADALNAASVTFSGNSKAATGVTLSLKSLTLSPLVNIGDNPSLKDVDGFAALTTVAGALTVNNNGVTNLDGFKSLASTGSVVISNNVALTSATGLSKLTTVSDLNVSQNQLLTSLPLTSLKQVTQQTAYQSSISITNNSALKSLTAPALTEIDGALSFTQNGNATDATVVDLSSLATLGGNLTISQNLGLQTLDKFTALTTAASVTIQNNASLKGIPGFSKLDTVGALSITSNGKLADLGGLAKLAHATSVQLTSNAALTTAAFPALTSLTADLTVSSNAALSTFSADAMHVAPSNVNISTNGVAGTPLKLSMAALSAVTGALTISANPGLVNLDGLGALVSIGQGVSLTNNDAMVNINGLSKLGTITGALSVSQNLLLANVTGLAGLTRVSQGITIQSNAAMTDVTLPALTSASSLAVSSNATLAAMKVDALTAISGSLQFQSNGTDAAVTGTTLSMATLTTVGQGFTVAYNPKLKLLTGFPVLSGIGGSYYVYSNVLLPTCSAVVLRTQVLSKGAIGSSTISGNLSDGCMP